MKNPLILVQCNVRDGLQAVKQAFVPLWQKLKIIELNIAAGHPVTEVGSFVNPKKVKQMAGSDRLTDIIATRFHEGRYPESTRFQVIALNATGAWNAIRAGVQKGFGELGVVVGMPDKFCLDNNGVENTEAALKQVDEVISIGNRLEVPVRGFISQIFVGREEGSAAEPERAAQVAHELVDMGVNEVVLSDTTGVGTPEEFQKLLNAIDRLDPRIPVEKLAAHFHDTNGHAVEMARMAFHYGIRTLDSSGGGLGGCAFAGSEVGNVATEALRSLFEKELGVATGLDPERLLVASAFALKAAGKQSPSQAYHDLAKETGFDERDLPSAEHEPFVNIENDGTCDFSRINIKLTPGADGKLIAYMALNRPDKLNSLNKELIEQIPLAINALEENSAVGAIVIMGQGKSFCAGADMTEMKDSISLPEDQNAAHALSLSNAFEAIYKCSKPTIAQVHGDVIAGGLGVMAACDYVVAQEGTKMQFTEVNLGLYPAMISAFVIPRLGEHNARVLMVGGKPFFSNHAADCGLVDMVKSVSTIDEAVVANANQAIREGKKAFRRHAKRFFGVEDSPEPVPKYHLKFNDDLKKRGRQETENGIHDMITEVVYSLLYCTAEGRLTLRTNLAKLIAKIRTTSHAQKQMEEAFFGRERASATPASQVLPPSPAPTY